MAGFLKILVANMLRLGAGMIVFIVLARQLGPSAFGTFVYWLAVATLATVPVNFGLNTAVLRQFGAAPTQRVEALSAALGAKLLLVVAVLAAGIVPFLLWVPAAGRALLLPLVIAQFAESFSEFQILSFRAASRYGAEAATASVVALLHISLMLMAPALLGADALVVAWAFCVSRVLGLVWTVWRAGRAYQPIRPSGLSDAWQALKQSTPYAVEFGMSTAYTQIDALVIEVVLGLRAVGLYQAGMKLVQGISRVAPILALYILPRLTSQLGQATAHASRGQSAARTLALFAAVGALGGGAMALLAEPLTHLLFGQQYSEVAALMPLFGVLLFLRFAETGAGLVLVAADLQAHKTWLVGVQLALMLGGGWLALQQGGLRAWLLTSLACTVLLLLMYAALWRRSQQNRNGVVG